MLWHELDLHAKITALADKQQQQADDIYSLENPLTDWMTIPFMAGSLAPAPPYFMANNKFTKAFLCTFGMQLTRQQ
jgi:hypothetical protein